MKVINSILAMIIIPLTNPSFACSKYVAVSVEKEDGKTAVVLLNTASGHLSSSDATGFDKDVRVSMVSDIRDAEYDRYLNRFSQNSSYHRHANSSGGGGVCGSFSIVAVKYGVVVVNSASGEIKGVTVN